MTCLGSPIWCHLKPIKLLKGSIHPLKLGLFSMCLKCSVRPTLQGSLMTSLQANPVSSPLLLNQTLTLPNTPVNKQSRNVETLNKHLFYKGGAKRSGKLYKFTRAHFFKVVITTLFQMDTSDQPVSPLSTSIQSPERGNLGGYPRPAVSYIISSCLNLSLT